jgi:hypothetical protein
MQKMVNWNSVSSRRARDSSALNSRPPIMWLNAKRQKPSWPTMTREYSHDDGVVPATATWVLTLVVLAHPNTLSWLDCPLLFIFLFCFNHKGCSRDSPLCHSQPIKLRSTMSVSSRCRTVGCHLTDCRSKTNKSKPSRLPMPTEWCRSTD